MKIEKASSIQQCLTLRFAAVWLLCLLAASACAQAQTAEEADKRPRGRPSVVKIVEKNGAYHLVRNGHPFFIKGVGGDGAKTLLRDIGGNAFRTWGADDLGPQLDEAQKLGLTVTVGIWLGHKEHGFDYNNADQVAEQYERAQQAILKYKDHPALLMWGIGNEMEVADNGRNAAVWSAINNIASMAKRLDPNHPTMTVIAEIGGDRVKNINRLCPDIDIIGINSYGGGASLAQRYKQAGGVKPYVVTEYGPPGIWEIGKNAWGAYPELSSTEKATLYRKTYQQSIVDQDLCLGGFAFIWGHKQEATATWFGMLLPDGSRLAAADALSEFWTGKPPAHPCPVLRSLKVESADEVDPGATVKATLDVSDPEGAPLQVQWVLQAEPRSFGTGGAGEAAPPTYPEAIAQADNTQATVKMPSTGGAYRLFAYVHNDHGGAAVANVPLLVKGAASAAVEPGAPTKLPLVVYDEGGQEGLPFIPSGYMGNTPAIQMDERCTVQPHAGKVCLRVQYRSNDNWGGVVWQSPPNDWGDQPGGKNLTGARRLTFWARGEKGSEVVTFFCGLIGREKPYYDTAQVRMENVRLTTEWKQYSLDLKGKDLTRIKSGFGWTVAALGAPITFYLDDIRFE